MYGSDLFLWICQKQFLQIDNVQNFELGVQAGTVVSTCGFTPGVFPVTSFQSFHTLFLLTLTFSLMFSALCGEPVTSTSAR